MQQTKQTAKELAWDYTLAIVGSVIFSVGLNLFIMPYGLLSANFTGVAQILDGVIKQHSGLPIPASFSLVGIIISIINIPLILVSYRQMSRQFFIKTILACVAGPVSISLIPIPAQPLLDSIITSCIIGGLITGFGAGVVLRSGGSGGGVDIVGLLITKRNPQFSVGKISIMIGTVVLAYALLQGDLNLVVYSTIYTVVSNLTLDKVHYQTIKTGAMIFSKTEAAQQFINRTFGRGVTCWKGYGAYSKEEMYVCYAVISKAEAVRLRREMRLLDPAAFIVFSDGLDVMGNYESHL